MASGDWESPEAGRSRVEGPVLVTGGAGYIGSHTTRLLQQQGIEAIVFDDLSTGHRHAVDAPLIVGDLLQRDVLREAFRRHRPRAVLHFAGKAYVGESTVDPSLYYRGNVAATAALLEEMRAASCRDIVFSSTCATYGIPDSLPITEASAQNPISPYGRTKLHVEHMLEDFMCAYGIRVAALRYFNAAGAAPDARLGEEHEPETHLIPLVLRVALGQSPEIVVNGADYPTPDGSCVRDYVHVVDLARAHVLALARLQAGGRHVVCNLGTGQGHSVFEVIETARRVTGREIPHRLAARRQGDPACLVADGARARELLGWVPERSSLEEITRDAWRFHTRAKTPVRRQPNAA